MGVDSSSLTISFYDKPTSLFRLKKNYRFTLTYPFSIEPKQPNDQSFGVNKNELKEIVKVPSVSCVTLTLFSVVDQFALKLFRSHCKKYSQKHTFLS